MLPGNIRSKPLDRLPIQLRKQANEQANAQVDAENAGYGEMGPPIRRPPTLVGPIQQAIKKNPSNNPSRCFCGCVAEKTLTRNTCNSDIQPEFVQNNGTHKLGNRLKRHGGRSRY
jgi:hypothetical protein